MDLSLGSALARTSRLRRLLAGYRPAARAAKVNALVNALVAAGLSPVTGTGSVARGGKVQPSPSGVDVNSPLATVVDLDIAGSELDILGTGRYRPPESHGCQEEELDPWHG